MQLIPKSPVVFLLVIVAFFALGMLAGKMLGKKKVEKFDNDSDEFDYGELNTPDGMAGGPKVLPPVPQNVGVVSGETMCKLANC